MKSVKNLVANFLAVLSMRREPNCAILPVTAALTS